VDLLADTYPSVVVRVEPNFEFIEHHVALSKPIHHVEDFFHLGMVLGESEVEFYLLFK